MSETKKREPQRTLLIKKHTKKEASANKQGIISSTIYGSGFKIKKASRPPLTGLLNSSPGKSDHNSPTTDTKKKWNATHRVIANKTTSTAFLTTFDDQVSSYPKLRSVKEPKDKLIYVKSTGVPLKFNLKDSPKGE